MRDTFVDTLLGLAKADPRVTLLTGDLGFGVLDKFACELPRQFLNLGVAEQNMTGVATGMALEGRIVFTYSIANFPTLRCLEQIRNDAAYHQANVNIVAIGGGFSYGSLGMSHHATEDIAILRAVPNLAVYAPCDDAETRAITRRLADGSGPAYLRLDKSKVVLGGDITVQPGRLRCLLPGSQVAVVACGGIVDEGLTAAETLRHRGVSCAVYSSHTIKPLDRESVVALAREFEAIVTLEEHVLSGGLGGAVAEALMDAGIRPRRFLRIALPDEFSAIVGSQEYLRTRLGIDAASIADRIGNMFIGKLRDEAVS